MTQELLYVLRCSGFSHLAPKDGQDLLWANHPSYRQRDILQKEDENPIARRSRMASQLILDSNFNLCQDRLMEELANSP